MPLVSVFFSTRGQSRVFSELERLRWQAGGTPDENDEEVRAAVSRQCRLSRLVVVKETRLAEVRGRPAFIKPFPIRSEQTRSDRIRSGQVKSDQRLERNEWLAVAFSHNK